MTDIILKSGKDISLYRRHPWIFSGAIKKIVGKPSEGEVVRVINNKDEFLGLGHYQDGSIAIRVFSFVEEKIDFNFWKQKIINAFELRKSLGLTENNETNAYRLVHGEGDGLPGLIIDYYNGTAVFQSHSIGFYLLKETFSDILKEIYGEKLLAVYDKSSETMPKRDYLTINNSYIFKSEFAKSETEILEYGNKFSVNWEEGQKTGFFLDQRENRKLLGEYSKNKKVLNTFCYTGGFSIYALKNGAKTVHSVDCSKKAIELTNHNVKINGFESNHYSFAVDTIDYFKESTEKFDVIILDPPAFAKHNNVLHNAMQGYKRINAKAIEQINPGGILFTFSCSQVVTSDLFRKAVFSAAASVGREVRILHFLSQPSDHACSIYHPEGEYLKGLVLYIE